MIVNRRQASVIKLYDAIENLSAEEEVFDGGFLASGTGGGGGGARRKTGKILTESERLERSERILRTLPSKAEHLRNIELTRLKTAMVITALVLLAALYIIIFNQNADSQKWAFGAVGLILGYWLK